MGETKGKGVKGVSHGICKECLAKLQIKGGEDETETENGHPE